MAPRDLACAFVLLALWPAVWFATFGHDLPVTVELAALASVPLAAGFATGRRWAAAVVLLSVALVIPVAIATIGVYAPDSGGDTSLGEGLLFVAFVYGIPAAGLVQLGVALRSHTVPR